MYQEPRVQPATLNHQDPSKESIKKYIQRLTIIYIAGLLLSCSTVIWDVLDLSKKLEGYQTVVFVFIAGLILQAEVRAELKKEPIIIEKLNGRFALLFWLNWFIFVTGIFFTVFLVVERRTATKNEKKLLLLASAVFLIFLNIPYGYLAFASCSVARKIDSARGASGERESLGGTGIAAERQNSNRVVQNNLNGGGGQTGGLNQPV